MLLKVAVLARLLLLRWLASIILEHYRPFQARDRVQFGEAEECFYYYIVTREIYRRILIQGDGGKEDKIRKIRQFHGQNRRFDSYVDNIRETTYTPINIGCEY